MDSDDIAKLVNQLNLVPDKDKKCCVVPTNLAKLGQNRLGSCLTAKVFSAKTINRDTFRNQMPRILQATNHVQVELVGDNIFLLEFKSINDKRQALVDGPWNFFKDLVIFKEPKGLQNPSEISFDDFTVWVQLHNLPLAFMHPDILRNIGGQIGNVIEIDTDEGGNCMGKFARLRITRKLSIPLQRGIWVSTENANDKICVLLLYEKLPNFCFACGRVGHIVRECIDSEVNKDILEFGAWLRAPFPSGGNKTNSSPNTRESNRTSTSSQATYKPSLVISKKQTEKDIPEPISPNSRLQADNESGEENIISDESVQETPMDMFRNKVHEPVTMETSEGLLLLDNKCSNNICGSEEKIVSKKFQWKRLARGKREVQMLDVKLIGTKHPLELTPEESKDFGIDKKAKKVMISSCLSTAVAASQPRRSL